MPERSHSDQGSSISQSTPSPTDHAPLLDAIGQAIFVLTPDYRIIDVNEAALALMKLPRSDIVGRLCYELCHEDGKQLDNCPAKRAAESGKVESIELTQPDGHVYVITCTPQLGQNGEIRTITHVATDITQIRHAEKELAQSEERYRCLVENTAECVTVVQDGLFRFVNSAFARLLGFPMEQVLGRPYSDFVHPSQREEHARSVQRRLMGSAEPPPERVLMVDSRGNVHAVAPRTTTISWQGAPALLSVSTDVTSLEATSLERSRLFDLSRDMLCVAGMDGFFKQVNPAFTRVLGWSAQELLSRPWSEFVHPADREATERIRADLIDGQTAYRFENRFRTKSGEFCWLSWNSYPVPAEGLMFGVARDVTAIRKMQDDITRQRDRAQLYLDVAGVAFIALDANGKVTLANAAALRLLGRDTGQIEGVDWFGTFVPEKDRTQVREVYVRLMRGELEPVEFVENSVVTGSGEERLIQWHNALLRDTDGSITGTLSSGRDITQTRKDEMLLERQRHEYEILLSNLPGMAYRCAYDKQWTMRFVSEGCRDLFGYEPDDFIGNKQVAYLDLIFPDDRPYVIAGVEGALRARKPFTLVYRVMTRTGAQKWVWKKGQFVKDIETGAEFLEGFISDITERVDAEHRIATMNQELENRVHERTAQLQAANRELEAFAYSVSHDLRAPLRRIVGFAKAVIDDSTGNLGAEAQANIERIRAAGQKMSTLIDDLLALSRVSRQQLRMSHIDLSEVARAIADDLRAANAGRNVTVRIQGGLSARADGTLIQAVMANLFGNAFKFTRNRADAVIEFGSEDHAGERTYFVRDNGVGFDMQFASKLFAPFQRLHPESDFEGDGIGLATVQRIISRHGGRVWAESAVGQGATFWFTLGDSGAYV